MKIVHALRPRNTLIVDPNDPRLVTGTPDEQRQARREYERARIARHIIATKEELPLSELDFEALGGRLIEHVASRDGDFYRMFGGDPGHAGDDVTTYFINAAGDPVMLQRATNPSSRTELEQKQAAKAQRRAEREAEAKERRRQLREGAQ